MKTADSFQNSEQDNIKNKHSYVQVSLDTSFVLRFIEKAICMIHCCVPPEKKPKLINVSVTE